MGAARVQGREAEPARDGHRHCTARGGPVPELSVGVVAPAIGCAVTGDAAGVGGSGIEPVETHDAHDRSRYPPIDSGPVLELAVAACCPTIGQADFGRILTCAI